jgi:hypothetical protein
VEQTICDRFQLHEKLTDGKYELLVRGCMLRVTPEAVMHALRTHEVRNLDVYRGGAAQEEADISLVHTTLRNGQNWLWRWFGAAPAALDVLGIVSCTQNARTQQLTFCSATHPDHPCPADAHSLNVRVGILLHSSSDAACEVQMVVRLNTTQLAWHTQWWLQSKREWLITRLLEYEQCAQQHIK